MDCFCKFSFKKTLTTIFKKKPFQVQSQFEKPQFLTRHSGRLREERSPRADDWRIRIEIPYCICPPRSVRIEILCGTGTRTTNEAGPALRADAQNYHVSVNCGASYGSWGYIDKEAIISHIQYCNSAIRKNSKSGTDSHEDGGFSMIQGCSSELPLFFRSIPDRFQFPGVPPKVQ